MDTKVWWILTFLKKHYKPLGDVPNECWNLMTSLLSTLLTHANTKSPFNNEQKIKLN
jgi:hypothetical protein